jgi:ArsR family metal-binding transcriptional regulator
MKPATSHDQGGSGLIHRWDLELIRPPCRPGAETWDVKARLEVDIGEWLPYLNAALPGASFYPGGGVLIWKNAGRKYAFRPREISSAPVKDDEEARRVIADAIQLANDIWSRREELEPDFTPAKEPPGLLEIYKLLPKTNCGECGRSTCMTFAKALRENAATVSECPPFCAPEHERERQRLLELLE